MDDYRYFLKLAYNGATFHGWQAQKNAHSVQQEIENCLFYLLGSKNIPLTGAGRTDTGVHARNYYAHFNYHLLLSESELENLVYKLNQMLPSSIGVYDAFIVSSDAHARFSATARTYRYFICRNHDPFSVGLSWMLTIPLDIEKMKRAAGMIIQYNNFTCFAKSGAQTKTNNCIVTESEWIESGNFLIYQTTANRFLRNMVRAMVGTLIDVGKGKITLDDFRKILEQGTRSDAGQSVPACGLFLENIEYPGSIAK
jgi:tRNA pseudouridine38-40 synthase